MTEWLIEDSRRCIVTEWLIKWLIDWLIEDRSQIDRLSRLSDMGYWPRAGAELQLGRD